MNLMAETQGGCPWCGSHMDWMGGWGMMLWWLLLLVIVVVVIWQMLRRRALGGRDSAEEALRERYARGEIDDETYRRMLTELRRR